MQDHFPAPSGSAPAERDVRALVARLDAAARGALREAVRFALGLGNASVEPEHLLLVLLRGDPTAAPTLTSAGIDAGRVVRDLEATCAGFRRHKAAAPILAAETLIWLAQAGDVPAVRDTSQEVGVGDLLTVVVEAGPTLDSLAGTAPSLAERSPISDPAEPPLPLDLPAAGGGGAPAGPGPASPGLAEPIGAAQSALDSFTLDMTASARAGLIDPVIGREAEIRQAVNILCRRRQNNPILVGEPGVGKTAVVEGLALRIAAGDVPPPLTHVALRLLDLGLLQAGAAMRGEFERRLKAVIEEVRSSATPVILFIDEAHTLIGAGGQAGQGDAANLLKPALARGEMRTIAATTWSEYKRYFERDAALSRRFQMVRVNEPDEAASIAMLVGLVPRLEHHHGVRIRTEALAGAVRLTRRYMIGRRLPDKAISVLDAACARVALAQAATPPAIEDADHAIRELSAERSLVHRDLIDGEGSPRRLAAIDAELDRLKRETEGLKHRWRRERDLVGHLIGLRGAEDDGAAADDAIATVEAELKALQGATPLVPECVDAAVVAEIVSDWTGVPAQRMQRRDEIGLTDLAQRLADRIHGQAAAMDRIAGQLRADMVGIGDTVRPVRAFLLAGPRGVGKQETARALADLIHGGSANLIHLSMAEFQDRQSLASLRGAPPGYIGYGEGGKLTEAVRRAPYSVLLLDDLDLAHDEVLALFRQMLERGRIEDADGVEVDVTNTLVIATVTVADDAMGEAGGPETQLLADLGRRLPRALIDRFDVVPFHPLDEAALREVARDRLSQVAEACLGRLGVTVTIAEEVAGRLVDRCRLRGDGAAGIGAMVDRLVVDPLAGYLAGASDRSRAVRVSFHAEADAAVVTPIETDAAGPPPITPPSLEMPT